MVAMFSLRRLWLFQSHSQKGKIIAQATCVDHDNCTGGFACWMTQQERRFRCKHGISATCLKVFDFGEGKCDFIGTASVGQADVGVQLIGSFFERVAAPSSVTRSICGRCLSNIISCGRTLVQRQWLSKPPNGIWRMPRSVF